VRLRPLHQQFALTAAAALLGMLRCRCEVRAAAIGQHTYGEFVRCQETPTCVAVLKAAPPASEFALAIPLGLLFPMLDRLLGGGREMGPVERRPLTTIERRLAARLCGTLAEQWTVAWRALAQLECSVDRVECDARAAQLAPPAESVVEMTYDVSTSGPGGRMTLCVSTAVLRAWMTPETGMATAGAIQSGETPDARAGKSDTSVEMVAQLSPATIPAADVVKLAVGDIITTSHPVAAPLELRVDGVTQYLVRPGVAKGHKAVQIVERADPPAGE
jgi:flagellar motor switch protein FliM